MYSQSQGYPAGMNYAPQAAQAGVQTDASQGQPRRNDGLNFDYDPATAITIDPNAQSSTGPQAYGGGTGPANGSYTQNTM